MSDIIFSWNNMAFYSDGVVAGICGFNCHYYRWEFDAEEERVIVYWWLRDVIGYHRDGKEGKKALGKDFTEQYIAGLNRLIVED